jgi:hypothetical protein
MREFWDPYRVEFEPYRCPFCSVMTVDASTNPDNEDLTARNVHQALAYPLT